MLITNQKVAIIGGGPGGLTLARLLQLKGQVVKVYEWDAGPAVRQQGSTLDLHEDGGLKALAAAGLMDAFKANYRPNAGKLRIADKQLNIYIDDHQSGSGYSEQRPEIDRGPLRDLLLEALHPETVVWDSQFVSMEKAPAGQGWQLYFKNGSVQSADLVVAADGARSRVRGYLTPVQPIYSGVTVIEGNIYEAARNAPKMWEFTKGAKVFLLDEEKSIICSAKADGTLSFYAGLNQQENWLEKAGLDFTDIGSYGVWLREVFTNWDPLVFELFNQEVSLIPRKMYHYPLNQRWATMADLTMIGDAAHLMPPYAGEGVNMAMLDALMLSEALTSFGQTDIKGAIEIYEAAMLKRAATVTAMTLDNTRILHGPDAIPQIRLIMQGA